MGWRLARSLETLSDEIRGRFPGTTIWTVGDADHRSRPSDHNPHDVDHDSRTADIVSAIDVVGHKQADAVWAHLLRTKDPRVEYAIHDGRVTGSDHGWNVRTYTGSNAHRNHTHVSVGRGTDRMVTRPDLYDDRSPWGFHGTTRTTGSEEEIVLTNGDGGNAVTVFQKALLAWRDEALPEYGADGDFGDETEEWVKRYQRAAEIPQTGNIDGVTASLLSRYVSMSGGGGTAKAEPHGHKIVANPKLTINAQPEAGALAAEIAANLRIDGRLHAEEA